MKEYAEPWKPQSNLERLFGSTALISRSSVHVFTQVGRLEGVRSSTACSTGLRSCRGPGHSGWVRGTQRSGIAGLRMQTAAARKPVCSTEGMHFTPGSVSQAFTQRSPTSYTVLHAGHLLPPLRINYQKPVEEEVRNQCQEQLGEADLGAVAGACFPGPCSVMTLLKEMKLPGV